MNDFIQLQDRENQRNAILPEQSTLGSQNRTEVESTTLSAAVERTVRQYMDTMQGQPITDLYDLVLSEVESPLLACTLEMTRGNQSLAAKVLGLNRGTLRKKLKKYDML